MLLTSALSKTSVETGRHCTLLKHLLYRAATTKILMSSGLGLIDCCILY